MGNHPPLSNARATRSSNPEGSGHRAKRAGDGGVEEERPGKARRAPKGEEMRGAEVLTT